jgi:Protein of unknown function (DUF1570)
MDGRQIDIPRRGPARHMVRATLMVLACAVVMVPAALAQRSSQAEPRDSGLVIPDRGIVRRGQGQHVTVRSNGQDVVALLHAEVGDRRLVILPDGRLESVPVAEAKLSAEPFRPATKEQIAAELAARGFKDFKVRGTARYVYVYNTSEPFYKGTSRILETMYPAVLAYFKRLKLPVDDPEVPLVAVMFRTEKEFQKYEPVGPSIAAYYNALSNQIVMYEQSDLVEVAPELAMKQSISTIAHEGIHQILHNIGVQQRLSRWPMWLSEGLAEYFAPTTVGARMRWKGVGKPNDLRMYELNQFMQARPARRGEMVEQVVGAANLTSSGYAAAWSLTHYLASRQRTRFHDYLRDVAEFGPLEPREGISADEAKKLFVQHFGDDFAALEESLLTHLRTLPYADPIANQTHYVVLIDTSTRRVAGVTSSPAEVRKWQEETLSKLPPAVRAATRFQVTPFADRASAKRYADRFLGRVD